MNIALEINCIDNGSIYNGKVDEQGTECLNDRETLPQLFTATFSYYISPNTLANWYIQVMSVSTKTTNVMDISIQLWSLLVNVLNGMKMQMIIKYESYDSLYIFKSILKIL